MDCPRDESLRIGNWRVEPALNEISRDGRTVRLEARAMGLLLRLAQRPGDVVSVDDLLSDVWSGVVVTTDSVYQAVALLRRELGDDARQPAYIATIPRLGYRLVAPVCPWTDEGAPSLAPSMPQPPPTSGSVLVASRKPYRLLVSGALAALLVIAAVQFWNYEPNAAVPAVVVMPFLDLTTQAMEEEYFADGLAEEVITRLSEVPGVRVAAPTSSYALQAKQLTASEIGQTLGAAYVIDGSIRRSDVRLRVSTRLTRAEDGYVVWSDTYEKPLIDKLDTQDEVAERVVTAMQRVLREQ